MKRLTTVCAVGALAIATVPLAGCGSSSSSSSSTQAAAATATQAADTTSAVVIGTYKTPKDGTLVVGANNRTLYVFQPDLKSTSAHDKTSTCYEGCAAVWPPVLSTGTPTVSGGANASLIGLTTRKDGTKQVTYNGMPLYYYAADQQAGQATGNHLKDNYGLWIAVLPSGKPAPDMGA